MRDLYVIEHQDKYLMVYRSSGLNPGRAGRILPFGFLAVPEQATFSGPTPGYIFKEFFFGGRFLSHSKEPSKFGLGIAEFLLELEEFLEGHPTEEVPFEHLKLLTDLLPIADAINKEMTEVIGTLEPYDWQDLIKE